MIKKIIILGLIIMAGYFFYKKYMASTLEPFFREKKGNVDFLGLGPLSSDKAKISP